MPHWRRAVAPRARVRPPGARRDPRPLIAHVVYRFDIGGLENGVANLISQGFRANPTWHAVVALTDVTDFTRPIPAQRRPIHCAEQEAGP